MKCAGLLGRRVLLRLEEFGLQPQALAWPFSHDPFLFRNPRLGFPWRPGSSLLCSLTILGGVVVLPLPPSWVEAGPHIACPRCPPTPGAWGCDGV